VTVPGGIHSTVEDHPVRPLWIQRAVDGTEIGAVRDAEVGDFPLAERGAYQVDVAGAVGRGVVRQRGADPRGAPLCGGAGELDVAVDRSVDVRIAQQDLRWQVR